MIEGDKPKFVALMRVIAELHSKKLSSDMLEVYWNALEKFELAEIRQALNNHVLNTECGQYMPKPADIIRMLRGSSEDHALRAWAKVTQAIKHVGSYSSIIFDDALIHAVITDMGGWIKLCQTNEDELVFRGKEFEKRYLGYVIRKPNVYPNRLIGTMEHSHQLQGRNSPQAVAWGDLTETLVVYMDGGDPTTLLSHAKQVLATLPSKDEAKNLLMASTTLDMPAQITQEKMK